MGTRLIVLLAISSLLVLMNDLTRVRLWMARVIIGHPSMILSRLFHPFCSSAAATRNPSGCWQIPCSATMISLSDSCSFLRMSLSAEATSVSTLFRSLRKLLSLHRDSSASKSDQATQLGLVPKSAGP